MNSLMQIVNVGSVMAKDIPAAEIAERRGRAAARMKADDFPNSRWEPSTAIQERFRKNCVHIAGNMTDSSESKLP